MPTAGTGSAQVCRPTTPSPAMPPTVVWRSEPTFSQRASAFASCALVIDERPLIPRLRASEYSWS